MDTHDSVGKVAESAVEFLADSRVRAVLLRPGSDLRWRSDVVQLPSDTPVALDRELCGAGTPWLVSATPPVARFARGLGPVVRSFEDLARRPTDARILAFAREFGWLGHGVGLQVVRSGPGFQALHAGGSPLLGESRSMWLTELAAFTWLRNLWQTTVEFVDARRMEVSGSEQRRQLRLHLRIGDGAISYRLPSPSPSDEAADEWTSVPDHGRRVTRNDLAAAGTFVVCHVINERVRGHVHPTLLPFQERAMSQVPDCLLGAIYLRFANEVSAMTKNPRPRQCEVCSATFGGNRNRQYCSDPCKERKRYLKKTGRWPTASRHE